MINRMFFLLFGWLVFTSCQQSEVYLFQVVDNDDTKIENVKIVFAIWSKSGLDDLSVKYQSYFSDSEGLIYPEIQTNYEFLDIVFTKNNFEIKILKNVTLEKNDTIKTYLSPSINCKQIANLKSVNDIIERKVILNDSVQYHLIDSLIEFKIDVTELGYKIEFKNKVIGLGSDLSSFFGSSKIEKSKNQIYFIDNDSGILKVYLKSKDLIIKTMIFPINQERVTFNKTSPILNIVYYSGESLSDFCFDLETVDNQDFLFNVRWK